ncbi:protein trichome birefringence-like 2 [Papaver somniferum]|uniref:protein trichome birefringence-like 2 n=1 Tax=Papaver somniferum TaxID=3469 RepID=UPI000E6F7FDC|nr:protein trichome birefringence-like 2 [Papaver somniferum]
MQLSIWDMLSTWPHQGVKKKATSILVGFGYLLGASILVLTVSSFIFPSVFASITNPLLKENLGRYYLKFGFSNWHHSPSSTTATTPARNSTTLDNLMEMYQTKNDSENSSAVKLVDPGENFISTSSNFSSDCDIFEGEWVMAKDPKPYYAPGSCPYLETRSFDCQGNGRPEDEYLKWEWQWQSHPRNAGCRNNLPSFLNATDFLERLRGKKLVFVGDSLNRNMYMSMACILWNAIPHKKRIVRSNGDFTTFYKDYNCTMAFVWSAFLVSNVGVSKSRQETVRLDLIDEQAASAYRDADVLVFDSGHWWVPKKTNNGVNFFKEGDNLYPQLDVNEAYRKGLTTWRKWVDKHIDSNKTQVVFRGFSPTHFKGTWTTGRGCNLATKPIPSNETYIKPQPIQLEILENALRKMKTHVLYLNISKLSYYRADAHPSVYRNVFKNYTFQERIEASQDCSHWCLPGVPDTWNELLYAALLKDGKGYFGKL